MCRESITTLERCSLWLELWAVAGQLGDHKGLVLLATTVSDCRSLAAGAIGSVSLFVCWVF